MDKTHIGLNQKRGAHFTQGHLEDHIKPSKYYGEYPIIYRSGLELKFMIKLERDPSVEKWTSEKIVIPYYIKEKVDGKVVLRKHEYFTDFTVHFKNGNIYVVEVKPLAQCPRNVKDIQSSPTMYKNACKWKAAIEYCKANKMTFKVITEKDIMNK